MLSSRLDLNQIAGEDSQSRCGTRPMDLGRKCCTVDLDLSYLGAPDEVEGCMGLLLPKFRIRLVYHIDDSMRRGRFSKPDGGVVELVSR